MLSDNNGQFLIPFFLEGLWIKGINPTGMGLVGNFSYPVQKSFEEVGAGLTLTWHSLSRYYITRLELIQNMVSV